MAFGFLFLLPDLHDLQPTVVFMRQEFIFMHSDFFGPFEIYFRDKSRNRD